MNSKLGRLLCAGIVVLGLDFAAEANTLPVAAGLVAQFQANDATVARGGAGEVTSWTAANDNSIVLTTSGTAASATNISYNATGMNGLPTIEVNDFFVDGTHDNLFMQGPILGGGGPLTSATIFWVGYFHPGRNGSLTDSSGQYAYSMNADGPSGSQFDNQIDDGFFELYTGSGTQRFDDISAHNGVYGIFRTEFHADGEHAGYRNGSTITGGKVADSPSYSVADDLILFGYQNSSGTSGGFNFVGNMSELIIYDRILDSGEVAEVERYLGSRIPEPSTVVIAVAALVGCGGLRRRK